MMTSERLQAITARYRNLRIAIVGDFCLDRYLEIDVTKAEISIETGLPVYNVGHVRSQPGAAGTILNNLVALGIEHIYPVGFAGEDGEGFELERSLAAKPGVHLDWFFRTDLRRTFTYTKPLLIQAGKAPVELNRLDFKNWTPTPSAVRERISQSVEELSSQVDALILLDQVDLAETGVITAEVLKAIKALSKARPELFIIADSRRSLRPFPPVCFKMNRAEFKGFTGNSGDFALEELKAAAARLAQRQGRPVIITLSEAGIVGALPSGQVEHAAARPLRGEIDIVGAGDSVTANLAAAWSAGATLREALELAMLASSIVIHQLGTTGTASIEQLGELLKRASALER
jgi:rfaE bifunctional protein kinase chain/domain